MKLKKVTKNLKLLALSFGAISTIATPMSVFASDEYPGTDYVPQVNGIPAFYINTIDPTNNQVEFYLNTLSGVEPERFGLAWIRDRSSAYLNKDVRSYPSVSERWSQKVFWSDDYELSLESYHSGDAGFIKKYTVDAIVSLKNNTFKDLYYIVEMKTGERWANKVTYGDCGWSWKEGKACESSGIQDGVLVDGVSYTLVDAPSKFYKLEIPKSGGEEPVVEPEPDPIPEPDPTPTPDPDPTPDPEPNPEPDDSEKNGQGTDEQKSDSTEEKPAETKPTTTDKPTNNSAATIAVVTPKDNDNSNKNSGSAQISIAVHENNASDEGDLEDEESPTLLENVVFSSDNQNTDSDGDVSEAVDGEDDGESDGVSEEGYEGFGDSTLDVPMLGDVSDDEDGEEKLTCEKINVVPYILLGAGIGIVSTLFLLFVIKKARDAKAFEE